MSPIYFVRLSKVWSTLYHGLVGQVHKKMLFNSFIYFFCIFCWFLSKDSCFYHFHFFRWSIKFPQQNINQSETWAGGFQLSVELYGWQKQQFILSFDYIHLFGLKHSIKEGILAESNRTQKLNYATTMNHFCSPILSVSHFCSKEDPLIFLLLEKSVYFFSLTPIIEK